MPLYDYKCESCGHGFERLMGTEEATPPCPECQGESAKVFSLRFASPGVGREKHNFQGVDFSRPTGGGGCCGGACRGHAH